MIRDITIGQYYPSESIVHELDPRVKIGATFVYILSLFFAKGFLGYGFAAFALLILTKVCKVPYSFLFRGIKSILMILILTAVLNLLTYSDGQVLFSIGVFSITVEGIGLAVAMCTRLLLLVMGSSLLTLTTTPIRLTDGIEALLRPFRKIGLPSHEIAMMMTIALRFIPTLLEETDKIMKAQQARGADFESGNIVHRAKNLVPILIPLFLSAFRRADELAMAMEARCYRGGEHRTRMKVLRFCLKDVGAMAILLAYISTMLVIYYK